MANKAAVQWQTRGDARGRGGATERRGGVRGRTEAEQEDAAVPRFERPRAALSPRGSKHPYLHPGAFDVETIWSQNAHAHLMRACC